MIAVNSVPLSIVLLSVFSLHGNETIRIMAASVIVSVDRIFVIKLVLLVHLLSSLLFLPYTVIFTNVIHIITITIIIIFIVIINDNDNGSDDI